MGFFLIIDQFIIFTYITMKRKNKNKIKFFKLKSEFFFGILDKGSLDLGCSTEINTMAVMNLFTGFIKIFNKEFVLYL